MGMVTEATTPRLFVVFAKRVQQAYHTVMCCWMRWRIRRQLAKIERGFEQLATNRAERRRIMKETDGLIHHRQSA